MRKNVGETKRIATKEALSRIYREDEDAQAEFSTICQRCGPDRPVVTDPPSNREALRYEYLASVLATGQHYSVTRSVPAMNAAGEPVEVMETKHMQLLAQVTSHVHHSTKT